MSEIEKLLEKWREEINKDDGGLRCSEEDIERRQLIKCKNALFVALRKDKKCSP